MSRIRNIITEAIRYKLKGCFDPEFRYRTKEFERLKSLPRYQTTTTDIFFDTRLQIVDAHSFLEMYDDIFGSEPYRFRTDKASPYIIDGGANIGLSVMYFKRLYPNSEIVAFEPDRANFRTLEYNVRQLKNVTLVPRALWSSESSLDFFAEGSWAGRLSQSGDEVSHQVKTVRLADYLARHVDFLKLDIEGAETEVLKDCAGLLGNVERIFVEYHSFVNQPQVLDKLLQILGEACFRVDINRYRSTRSPFDAHDAFLGMDLQLNIFAYRT